MDRENMSIQEINRLDCGIGGINESITILPQPKSASKKLEIRVSVSEVGKLMDYCDNKFSVVGDPHRYIREDEKGQLIFVVNFYICRGETTYFIDIDDFLYGNLHNKE